MKVRFAIGLILVTIASIGGPVAETVPGLVREGNRLYEQGEFGAALEQYRRAEALDPANPVIQYNIGNVLYRQGEYDKAQERYRQAFADPDSALAGDARYNAGNANFAKESWQDAILNYREALRLDPEDPDAKRNLELALRRLQEEQQQQQQRQQQQQENEDQSQPQSQQQESSTPQEPQDEPSGQQGAPPEPRDQQAQEPRPEDRSDELSREEAMRLLDGMGDEDRPPTDRLKVSPPDRRPEKDW